MDFSPLPIDAALPDLTAALRANDAAVLVAPPGAGKTTRVPLILAGEEWAKDRRILVLEPRRLAARAAAARMAATLNERVGETVGLRVRFGSKVSRKTRIEIVTEGIFTRLILDDPMLEGVAAVLFDEFHERSLDADLGLALARDAQQGLREDLKLLVMSATIDGARIAGLLGDAPVIASEGRAFPVETRYVGRDTRAIEPQIADSSSARCAPIAARCWRFCPAPPKSAAPRRCCENRTDAVDRRRFALRRAGRRRAAARHRAGAARPAQNRAGDFDRGNLDHHRGRAHRRRLRARAGAALRARRRRDAARNRSGVARGAPISAAAAPAAPSRASATGCGTSRRPPRSNPSPGRKSLPPTCRLSHSTSRPGAAVRKSSRFSIRRRGRR